MTETQLLTIASALVAVLFGLLTTVLGWLGSKIYSKLDEVVGALQSVRSELHERITDTDRRHQDQYVEIDRRLTTIETRCEGRHP
jgi:uncharacterized protein YoxC